MLHPQRPRHRRYKMAPRRRPCCTGGSAAPICCCCCCRCRRCTLSQRSVHQLPLGIVARSNVFGDQHPRHALPANIASQPGRSGGMPVSGQASWQASSCACPWHTGPHQMNSAPRCCASTAIALQAPHRCTESALHQSRSASASLPRKQQKRLMKVTTRPACATSSSICMHGQQRRQQLGDWP